MGKHAVRLETGDMKYMLFPIVHICKLKRAKKSPDRLNHPLVLDQADRVDFDEWVLPEDIWERGTVMGGRLGLEFSSLPAGV